MSTFGTVCLILAVPAALCAQGPRPGMFPWWESPVARSLNLTEAQNAQIRTVTGEYRAHLTNVRAAVERAETELEAVFNDDAVDQKKGAEAIDHLVKARSEMTKAVSEMSLKLRAVLTPQQWQILQRGPVRPGEPVVGSGSGSGVERGPGRGPGRGRRGGPKTPPAN